ncbi:hypothetical protein [Sphingomonas sp. S2-65]|uniref:hypothetical protein n=1 Tax=Sphingomonas sp. S2-65 TaxID=2903960 RepID=UPI001F3810B0|nr:hypothetical protein [Sphingomonas sp. S2-65]UYY59951.1 hypothetical protein LZ586_07660 [Sphingomonas sp. S2-65]
MGNQPDYRAQAAKCRADADTSTLDNVRDRNLRAEAAWLEMAVRQDRVTASRRDREPALQEIPLQETA